MRRIAGVDEAGRGALAGPVVAGAVILNPARVIRGVTDSKRLTPETRAALYDRINARAVAVAVAVVEVSVIDRQNILQAALQAMAEAVSRLSPQPEYLLVDGTMLPPSSLPGMAVPHGDLLCPSVAAASIIAKVTRDRLMEAYHATFPDYGFDTHKGYGTAEHLQALNRFGPSPIHRQSFGPVRQIRLPFDLLPERGGGA